MENLDIIAIGAINFDCIFFTKKKASKTKDNFEAGAEEMKKDFRSELYEDINTLKISTLDNYTQIGGSSFLALKTASCIESNLKTAFVGVCGGPSEEDKRLGFISPKDTKVFDFLSNDDWLFYDDEFVGLALATLNQNNERDEIRIDPGANDNLLRHIERREKETGKSFVDFLSSTRWIHLSSLEDEKQFMYIIERIKEAKQINPLIRVSIDPGFQYMKDNKIKLLPVFKIVDYIFLNEAEMGKLVGDETLADRFKNDKLKYFFNNNGLSNIQAIVVKNKRKNEIFSFLNASLYTANFWHKKIKKGTILNDIGAGDAFVGGFIAALLSPRYIVHQPFPMELGAVAASARLCSRYDPFDQIYKDTDKYIKKMQKKEKYNSIQRIKLYFQNVQENISIYISGIVTGLIVWVIQLIVGLLNK